MAPITLYTGATPNGWKASVTLEELGLEYDVHGIDISTNVQKEEWFLKINPNGRIPAIVDHSNGDLKVFETGSIMWYLAQKYDKENKLWPKEFNKQSEVISWLMFQMGGIGPMQGQAHHFVQYSKPKIPYGMNRYQAETERLYSVLERQLSTHEWLAADQFTIADIASFTWVFMGAHAGADYEKFPNVKKWVKKISERPAVRKGLEVPQKSKLVDLLDEDHRKNYLQETLEKIQKAEKDFPNQGLSP